LLAFHSVENVGIILIGAGLAMLWSWPLGRTAGHVGPDRVVVTHANSARFKGLLFLGAGSGDQPHRRAQPWRNWRAGRRMPWTAWLFLLGAGGHLGAATLNGS